jgi:hypothetical protein
MQQPFLVSVKARNLLICPYLRLTAETKSRLHEIVSDLFEMKLLFS